MAIEYEDILETVREIRNISNELLELVVTGERDGVEDSFVGTVPFTDNQKQSLETKYSDLVDSLKNEVVKL